MLSIDRFQELLDACASALPPEIFIRLNGGILLKEEEKPHPEGADGNLFILGEYHSERTLGRYIVIYYGSFARSFPNLDEAALKAQIDKTLKHEFVHHLESLAGEKDLEIKDRLFLDQYRQSFLGFVK